MYELREHLRARELKRLLGPRTAAHSCAFTRKVIQDIQTRPTEEVPPGRGVRAGWQGSEDGRRFRKEMAAQIKEWQHLRSEEHAGPPWTMGEGGEVAVSEEGNGAADLLEMGQAQPQTQQLCEQSLVSTITGRQRASVQRVERIDVDDADRAGSGPMGMEQQEAAPREAADAGRDGSGCQPAASSPVGAGSVASSGEDTDAEKFVFWSAEGGDGLCAQRQRRSEELQGAEAAAAAAAAQSSQNLEMVNLRRDFKRLSTLVHVLQGRNSQLERVPSAPSCAYVRVCARARAHVCAGVSKRRGLCRPSVRAWLKTGNIIFGCTGNQHCKADASS